MFLYVCEEIFSLYHLKIGNFVCVCEIILSFLLDPLLNTSFESLAVIQMFFSVFSHHIFPFIFTNFTRTANKLYIILCSLTLLFILNNMNSFYKFFLHH